MRREEYELIKWRTRDKQNDIIDILEIKDIWWRYSKFSISQRISKFAEELKIDSQVHLTYRKIFTVYDTVVIEMTIDESHSYYSRNSEKTTM